MTHLLNTISLISFFFLSGINDMMYKMTLVPTRISSEQAVGSMLASYSSRKYASGNDITEAVAEVTINKKDKRKNVKFNTAVHVVLIPTRKDYRNAGLGEVMWFSDDDYRLFKESATVEVKRYMAIHSNINCKEVTYSLTYLFNLLLTLFLKLYRH